MIGEGVPGDGLGGRALGTVATRGGEGGGVAPGLGVGLWSTALAFLGVALLLLVVTAASARFLPLQHHSIRVTPGRGDWAQVWANWDGAWYRGIAERGYSYTRHGQLSVAFFPAYPLMLRAGVWLGADAVVTGVSLTIACGLGTALLFRLWLHDRVLPEVAWSALLLLLLFPYAFYLYGPLYADAFFLAGALAAFVLLERGHAWPAGALGAIAAVARPIGAVLVVGLVLRAVELRRARDPGHASRQDQWTQDQWTSRRKRRAWWIDGGVLVSALGLVGYGLYLWWRFGDPLAFVTAERGWHQRPGPGTWFKVRLFSELSHSSSSYRALIRLAHPLVTLGALALVPRVVRRFGRAYGVYALLVLALPAISTKDFFGMGRYVLAAFPCFAIAGLWLAQRRGLRLVILVTSGAGLVAFASLFGRGYYLS